MILELAFTASVAWILMRAVRQNRCFRGVPATSSQPGEKITVIIPVRNEQRNVKACVKSLLAQDYSPDLYRIVVVDDESTDATFAEASALQDQRLMVVRAPPLPPGWTGKTHASWHGAQMSGGEYLCFVDADARASPSLLRRAVACAESEAIDMLSLEPFQEMKTIWERLIFPAGFLLLAATQDLAAVNSPDHSPATANGQFILIRRDVYDTVGGHAAVRQTVAEDSALAACVKGGGRRIALLDGADLLRVRMYRSLPELWEGLSKTVLIMLHGAFAAVVSALLACAIATAAVGLPAAAALQLFRRPDAIHIVEIILAGGPSLALLLTHIGIARHFRFPTICALLFPAGYLLGAALIASSVYRQYRGRVSWKGRTYLAAANCSSQDGLT